MRKEDRRDREGGRKKEKMRGYRGGERQREVKRERKRRELESDKVKGDKE